MRRKIIVLFGFFSFSLFACEHIPYGKPSNSDLFKCRKGYAIGYSYSLKAAEWVAYKLEKQNWLSVSRENDFRVDLDIPTIYRTYKSDYNEPKYHMGHLVSSESLDKTKQQNSETFIMSNITPQLPGHNQAIWKGLENRERKWADNRGLVYIITGGIYRPPISYIGDKVPIPSDYYKIIIDMTSKESLAYLIPHKNIKTAKLDNYLTSIDEIESVSGLNFLQGLNASEESNIESTVAKKQWN